MSLKTKTKQKNHPCPPNNPQKSLWYSTEVFLFQITARRTQKNYQIEGDNKVPTAVLEQLHRRCEKVDDCSTDIQECFTYANREINEFFQPMYFPITKWISEPDTYFWLPEVVCDGTIPLQPMHLLLSSSWFSCLFLFLELFPLQHVLQHNLSAEARVFHQADQRNLLNTGKKYWPLFKITRISL